MARLAKKGLVATGGGTIDTNSSIRIQSPKWHGKVRAIATSAFLIPVRRFPPELSVPSFSPYLPLSFCFLLPPDRQKFPPAEEIRLHWWLSRANLLVLNGPPVRARARNSPPIFSSRNHPVYNVSDEAKVARGDRAVNLPSNARGNREEAILRACPPPPRFCRRSGKKCDGIARTHSRFASHPP